MRGNLSVLVVLLSILVFGNESMAVNLQLVPVGNPGNAANVQYGQEFGRVDYTYSIGKYEVTAGQYCEFLNAVAKTDAYGLYNPNMNLDAYPTAKGCNIKRSGVPGNYSYSVDSNWANRPVNYVSWGDSARFCNWLNNGQPTGSQGLTTTENGSYYLNGVTTQAGLASVSRAASARYVLPTENEWYKAAYHKNDGVTGNYWLFPTSSDTPPSNQLLTPDPGNNANYSIDTRNSYTIGAPYYRTEVGAFANSDSPYGTFDQGGNVWERNEAVMYDYMFGWLRGSRGGSATCGDVMFLASSSGNVLDNFESPTNEAYHTGFRIAEVPEPASLLTIALASLVVMRRPRG